jgi:hypothetical protein
MRDCSSATGFIQPVHDEGMHGCVAGLRLGLHAPSPAPGAHRSALASAPGRHAGASCDSAGCPAPPPARWRACSNVGAKSFFRGSPHGGNRGSRRRRWASLARAVWGRPRRSHHASPCSMTARSARHWGHPRLTRQRGFRAVVCRGRWPKSARAVHNAGRGAASRFLVRAAGWAAGVLGRPVRRWGWGAARPWRALATAPPPPL